MGLGKGRCVCVHAHARTRLMTVWFGVNRMVVSITNNLVMTFVKFCANFNFEALFSKTSYNSLLLGKGIVN